MIRFSEPLSALPLGLSTPSGSPSASTADLDALGTPAELHFADSAALYSHADWKRGQYAEPAYYTATQYVLLGRPLALPTEVLALPTEVLARFPSHQRSSFSQSEELAGKGRLHTTNEGVVLLLRNPFPALLLPTTGGTRGLPFG